MRYVRVAGSNIEAFVRRSERSMSQRVEPSAAGASIESVPTLDGRCRTIRSIKEPSPLVESPQASRISRWITTSSGESFPPTVRVRGWIRMDAGAKGLVAACAAPPPPPALPLPRIGPGLAGSEEDIHEHPPRRDAAAMLSRIDEIRAIRP
jgi:hypothetical protein